VETFLTEQMSLDGWIDHHQFAVASEGAGRPSGGLAVFAKKGLPKLSIKYKDEFSLVLDNGSTEIAVF